MRYLIYGVFCLSSGLAYTAEVYKCVDQSNKVVYRDTPCSTGKQQVLDDLPSNSIKAVPTREPTPTPDPATITPTPMPRPTAEPDFRADPDAPLTQNCSVDNPYRDKEFCRTKNLPGLYPEYRPGNRPRVQPLKR